MSLALAGPGKGKAASDAELRRLEDDLIKHAQRNSWSAVENVYRRMLEIAPTASALDHLLGAQAALDRGEPLLAWYRLRRITAPGADEPREQHEAFRSSQDLLASLESRYGRVSISVPSNQVPAMVRPHMPFAQEERDVITTAREKLRTQRAYRGLLPEGVYTIDGHRFEVEPQWEAWRVVVVGDPSTADEPRLDREASAADANVSGAGAGPSQPVEPPPSDDPPSDDVSGGGAPNEDLTAPDGGLDPE